MTFVKLHKPHIAYRVPDGEFAIGTHNPVRIVLHDTESGVSSRPLADIHAVINAWMETPLPGRLGAQFIADAHGNLGQTARATAITQHVGGLNDGSIGIEQIGFASMTRAEWHARPLQLEKVSRLIAYLHSRYGIPIEHGKVFECEHATSGIVTHAAVSKVCAASEGHTDPGSGYPLDFVIARARFIRERGGWNRL